MDRVAALPALGFEGGKRCEQFSEHSECCLHGSRQLLQVKGRPVHIQNCVHSVQGRYGQGWLWGGDVAGDQSGPSKEDGSDRPAREGARLVIRHQEETNSGV